MSIAAQGSIPSSSQTAGQGTQPQAEACRNVLIEKEEEEDGGAERDRTVDPLLAKQVLSQLSYSPTFGCLRQSMVGLGRFELPTSPLSGVRSNQLSYRPERPILLAAPLPAFNTARSPAALQNLIHLKKGFEDKVERARQLRRR